MSKSICVFCSSSDAVEAAFFDTAAELGAMLAWRGHTLVYGGTDVGLMGALARSAHQNGGKVVGIIPSAIQDKGIAYQSADELIVTRDLRERKALMEARADAFVALPGGFGTLEETLEILTLKQLGLHSKALVLLNSGGFYEPLLGLFEHLYEQRLAKPVYRQLYHVAPDAAGALDYIEAYAPQALPSKWF